MKLNHLTKWINRDFFVKLCNLLVIVFLFFLPYYLFNGRLFLGGDDTRLHYVYPLNFLQNLSFYSWVNISSLPSYLPNHHSIPFLLILYFLGLIIQSKTILFYATFSFPFVLGFIYFQKFIKLFVDNNPEIPFISSLIYIFSPITAISQMSTFLFSMYLVGLIPLIGYYYVVFLKYGKEIDIAKVVVISILLSITFYAIQWIAAVLLPLSCGLLVLIFIDSPIRKILKKSLIFFYFVLSSQIFWLFPFFMSLVYKGGNDLGNKLASKDFVNSFAQTVQSTATDNIIYPLLTFYHRQIAFDYGWQVSHVFSSYFDYVLPFSTIFIFILFLGILKYNNLLRKDKGKVFIFFFISFMFALYFSTINIGVLKNLFIFLGYLPGFAIFRNFTDKFAIGYIFIYSTLIGLCLYVIKKSYTFYPFILISVIAVTFVNFWPVKQIVAQPLWKTSNIFTTVALPQEYIFFTQNAKKVIPNDANIITFPQNLADYSIVSENDGKHAYVGTSPFKFFTGINDLSGSGSYPSLISSKIHDSIMNRKYNELLDLFSQINVGYIMVTQNIPNEVLNSYLFDKSYLKFQDRQMLGSIIDREVLRSEKGNYIIYKLRNSPKTIILNGKIEYQKVNQVLYKIEIKNLTKNQKLIFLESYHPGWKLFLSKNGTSMRNDYFSNIKFIFSKTVFDNTHKSANPYGNEWTINPQKIIGKFNNSYYKKEKDDSIDLVLYLYFYPQYYFYFGVVLTIIFLSCGLMLLNYKKNERREKN